MILAYISVSGPNYIRTFLKIVTFFKFHPKMLILIFIRCKFVAPCYLTVTLNKFYARLHKSSILCKCIDCCPGKFNKVFVFKIFVLNKKSFLNSCSFQSFLSLLKANIEKVKFRIFLNFCKILFNKFTTLKV